MIVEMAGRWLLKLAEPSNERDRFDEVVSSLEDVLVDESGIYLTCPEAEGADTPSEAHKLLSDRLASLNSALEFFGGEEERLSSSGLFKVAPDGSKIGHIMAVASLSAHAYLGHLHAGDRDTRVVRRRNLMRLMSSDPRVAQVLQLLALPAQSPPVLYNILEGVIRYGLGATSWDRAIKRGEELGLGTEAVLRNLKYSLQHPATSGVEARHYFGANAGPSPELSLGQVRREVRRVARKWIDYRLQIFLETPKQ